MEWLLIEQDQLTIQINLDKVHITSLSENEEGKFFWVFHFQNPIFAMKSEKSEGSYEFIHDFIESEFFETRLDAMQWFNQNVVNL